MTAPWSPDELRLMNAAGELHIAVKRSDGSLQRWVPICHRADRRYRGPTPGCASELAGPHRHKADLTGTGPGFVPGRGRHR